MQTADILNHKFKNGHYPFQASIHLGPNNEEVVLIDLPSGATSAMTSEGQHDLDKPLELMSEIRSYNHLLLNDTTKLTPNHFEILSEPENGPEQKITVNIGTDIDINIETKVYHEQVVKINDISHRIDIENKHQQNKTAKTIEDAKYQLKHMLQKSNEFVYHAEQTNETLNNNTKQIITEPKSEPFPYPSYTGEMNIKELNDWVESQGLPLHYIDSYRQNHIISLCNNENVVIANYILPDEEMIDDLNFLNQLNNIEPKYIDNIYSMLEEGVVLKLPDADTPDFVEIQHMGQGHIYLTTHDNYRGHTLHNDNGTTNIIESYIDISSHKQTNLTNLKTDVDTITEAAHEIKNDIVDKCNQLTELTYDDSLTIDDLQISDKQETIER